MKKTIVLKTTSYMLSVIIFIITMINIIYTFQGNKLPFNSSYFYIVLGLWFLYIDSASKNKIELKTTRNIVLISFILYSLVGLILLLLGYDI